MKRLFYSFSLLFFASNLFAQTPIDPPSDDDPPAQSIVNIKLYLEGFYDINTHAMKPVKYNQGLTANQTIVEDITLELRHQTTGIVIDSKVIMLNTNGTATAIFNGSIIGNYYLAIKHRNSIQTWSATPINIGPLATANYDFSNNITKAYGGNMKEIETGIFAFFTGDINQDDIIDPSDYSVWEVDSDAFAFGDYTTDLNGDGVVDPSDYSVWEINSDSFIFANYPTF